MPVVAVVAAVALDAGVVGTAIASGIGAISVLSAVTAIGATVGAIGAVTHNKTLSLVGGALGIVGGIGTLAAGSGALGSVGDLFGSSAGDAGAAGSAAGAAAVGDGGVAANGAEAAYQPGAVTASDLPGAASTTSTAANPVGAINATSLAPAEGDAAAIETAGQADSPLAGSLTDSASTTLTGPPQASAFAPQGVGPAANADIPSGAAGTDAWAAHLFGTTLDGAPLTDDTTGSGSGIMNWAHNNQTLSYGILQAGGSFLSGLTNPMTPAQINALNAQAAANNAAAALTEREIANQGKGLPTAGVTGVAAPEGGLINNSKVRPALITGTPNTGAAPVAAGAMA